MNYIKLVCHFGPNVRLRCGWDPEYRKQVQQYMRYLNG